MLVQNKIPHNTQNINPIKNVNSTKKIDCSNVPSKSIQNQEPWHIPFRNNYHQLAFLGNTDHNKIEDIIKSVNKKYQGKGLLDKNFIDWSKVGWNNLKQEPIDWKTANDSEIMTFWYALALAEIKENDWPNRFNPTNVPAHLAVQRALASQEGIKIFFTNLELLKLSNFSDDLKALRKNVIDEDDSEILKTLNQPVINPETGKLNFGFIAFDTETTGTNIYPKKGPVDKIIQMGIVKVDPDEKIRPDGVINQLINPEVEIPEEATKVHHITNDMLKNEPIMNKVLPEYTKKYMDGNLLVAYNAKFDIGMINNEISEYNRKHQDKISNRKIYLTLDPYILIMRIHPYLGSKKTLNEQHKFLFGRDVEGAHDALEDTKATINILKYCCHYLNKHYKPSKENPKKHLTIRDVLTFQLGGKVKDLNIKLDTCGYNAEKDKDLSYELIDLGVNNYHDGYVISTPSNRNPYKKNVIAEVASKIGPDNVAKLTDEENHWALNKKYKLLRNFKKVLDIIGIEGYNGKSKEEIFDIIAEKSIHHSNNQVIRIWMKNVKLKDQEKGNDLPDIDIVRKIMTENEDQDKQA
ncbi:MAG: hypothetical protein A2255_10250 [Candidatus Melainabacteria bacterium RIFOXYA2_FULL_32_9]|nr:MAG: hypothetical protein A2255_10250 [Candidatus Melainabacteria bacterium RIFOXYA2_FULL_32_9]